MKDVISIDTKIIEIFKKEGDKFLFDPKAESVLLKWEEFKELIEKTDQQIKAIMSAKMSENNTLKIDGEKVKVLKSKHGAEFEVIDPEIALQMDFAEKEEKVKPISKNIKEYIKGTGELPEGIKLRDRAYTITISLIK